MTYKFVSVISIFLLSLSLTFSNNFLKADSEMRGANTTKKLLEEGYPRTVESWDESVIPSSE